MEKMPVLFIGHGSPMNISEDNHFTRRWQEIAARLPVPKTILCISAHWFGDGLFLSEAQYPPTIYDFYGFPPKLYSIEYPALGAPELAKRSAKLLPGAVLDAGRGLDHGAWCVLKAMYPKADIPVCQLSINALLSTRQSYELGCRLAPLRNEKVLILGSGNVVHNLALLDWGLKGGYPWAEEFDAYIKNAVLGNRHEEVIEYRRSGIPEGQAFVYRDHFEPLLYVLGAAGDENDVQVFNDEFLMGSLSMTSYLFS